MESNSFIEKIDLQVSRKLSISQALKNEILPLYEDENKVVVLKSKERKESKEGYEIIDFLFNKKAEYIEVESRELLDLIKNVLNKSVVNMEEEIIYEGIKAGASDIHFEPTKLSLNIRFRINGDLVLVKKIPLESYGQIISRLKIKANMDITEKRVPQDGKLSINIRGNSYDCRLSTVPLIYGEKLVLRILYADRFLYDLEELKLTNKQKEKLNKIVKTKNGIVLINGPTGSGKSTTLYTILNSIKGENINVTTLEDPIEVFIEGINQINLNPKIGITFAKGLRSILRQDPDVIMLGEIRDEETAKMAIRAAITGHKVYSTIHTKSPREVYFRLEEMGVPFYLIKDAVTGIISQRLIKTLCPKCKILGESKYIKGKTIKTYYKGGCPNCNGTGYVGRSIIASIINIDNALRKASLNSKEVSGFTNEEMLENLFQILEKGEIDYYDYLDFIEGEELSEFFKEKEG